MLSYINKAVFLCAHTDDEMVCAGTLRRLVREDAEVHVIAFGPAATKEDRLGGEHSLQVVLPEWHKSLDLIGVKKENRKCCGLLPSAHMASYNEGICQYIYDYCEKHKPDLVITLSPEDENTAHAVVGRESDRVMRGRVPMVLRCQFPWNYSIGRPNVFVSLSEEDVQVKQLVIDCYQSQKFRYGYSNILMSQTIVDGQSVKAQKAEKFELVRWVV